MALLRNRILGTWELMSFSARDADTGVVRHPLGREPSGLIMYTDDGYMSAQLTSRPSPGRDTSNLDSSTADADYVAYGGRFHVDEQSATLQHEVTISILADLLSQPQFRHAEVDGDRLTLSAITRRRDGTTVHATLVWRRPTQAKTETR